MQIVKPLKVKEIVGQSIGWWERLNGVEHRPSYLNVAYLTVATFTTATTIPSMADAEGAICMGICSNIAL